MAEGPSPWYDHERDCEPWEHRQTGRVTMSDCKHEDIAVWRIEETTEPAGLWSCRDCGVKFYPWNEVEEMIDRKIDSLTTEGERKNVVVLAVAAYRKARYNATADRAVLWQAVEDALDAVSGTQEPGNG